MGRDETQKILFPQVHTIIKLWGCNSKRFDFKAVSSTYFYKNSLLSYKPEKILNLDIFLLKKKIILKTAWIYHGLIITHYSWGSD